MFALRVNTAAGSTVDMARGDVTDAEWALIEPWLPLGGRGPVPDLRRQLNGVIHHFRTGSPWRDVPAEYGSRSTVYDRFRAWALSGVMQNLQERMIAEAAARGQVDLSLVSVDSTSQRAHQHAAGMAVDPELLRALEKAAEEEKGVRARDNL
ncbi:MULTISPECIES: transposase [Streptosporangium]|uniref:Transposase n=1 Tax=Streptosporangium brasiliense TaxID=47480 RepID=A0ABT9RHK0_9ACTN|nr:transposase [Streptosporangium brasiliense]MDP9868753.1 transposase [Streptosporangium brasiliense]